MDALWPLAVAVGLALLGLPAAISLMIAGTAMLLTNFPEATVTALVSGTAVQTVSYPVAGAFLLLLLGAWLQALGAVQTAPAPRSGPREDVDRAAWFSGSALGLALPVTSSLVFLCLVAEVSIGDAFQASLIPALILSAIYLALLFALPAARHAAAAGIPPRNSMFGFVIAIRTIIPPVLLVIILAPISTGLFTPNEALAVAICLLAPIAIVIAFLIPHGWRHTGRGLAAGARGSAALLLLMVGLVIFGQGAALKQINGPESPIFQAVAGGQIPAVLVIVLLPLVLGIVLGPIAAVGLSAIFVLPAAQSAEIDRTVVVITLFLVAEAVRVGPQVYRPGFLRRARGAGAGSGSWPFYVAAVATAFGYGLIATNL